MNEWKRIAICKRSNDFLGVIFRKFPGDPYLCALFSLNDKDNTSKWNADVFFISASLDDIIKLLIKLLSKRCWIACIVPTIHVPIIASYDIQEI